MKMLLENKSRQSIGIFDSGLGGLSVCKEIVALLPNESIIYLADSLNAPYGDKTKEEIIDLSVKNTKLLLKLGCKVVVVACNTATTNAISTLRSKFNVPFIGIEPATKSAALKTKAGKIGVLATKGTLASDLFLTTSNQFRDEIEMIEVEGKGLVKLIEKGNLEKTKPLLEKYLKPMIGKGVDSIVLGCTHYPFLIPIIKELVPNSVNIIDSGAAVAKQTQYILEKDKLITSHTKNKENLFYTNKNSAVLKQFLQQIKLEGQVSFREF